MSRRKPRILVSLTIVFSTLVFSLTLAGSACSSGTKPPPVVPVPGPAPTTPAQPAANNTAAVSYSKDVQVIFDTTCVVCHQGQGAGQSGLSLEPRVSYGNLVGANSTENPKELRVKAGAPDQSYLIAKLTGVQVAAGGMGGQMPFDASPLSAVQIDLITQWISQGALNN